MRGGYVCDTHGGTAPQTRAKAALRLEDLRPRAIQVASELLEAVEYPTVRLGAYRDVLDRCDGRATERVELSGSVVIGEALEAARQRARERNKKR